MERPDRSLSHSSMRGQTPFARLPRNGYNPLYLPCRDCGLPIFSATIPLSGRARMPRPAIPALVWKQRP